MQNKELEETIISLREGLAKRDKIITDLKVKIEESFKQGYDAGMEYAKRINQ